MTRTDGASREDERRGARLGFWVFAIVGLCAAGFGMAAGAGVGGSGADGDGAIDVGLALDTTGQLERYRVSFIQSTATGEMTGETIAIGRNVSGVTRFGGFTSEYRVVDGRYYELDREVWYLKPWPARMLTPPEELADLTSGLRTIPTVVVSQSTDVVTLEITCGSADRASVPEAARELCDDRAVVTAQIDVASGLLSRVRADGLIQVRPGDFEQGFTDMRIEPMAVGDVIEPPSWADETRAACIGAELGTDDYAAMSERLDGTTTNQNQQLFNGCGFDFYPPGSDFEPTD